MPPLRRWSFARAVDTGLAFQDDCVEALNHFERRPGRGGVREDAEPAAQIQFDRTRACAAGALIADRATKVLVALRFSHGGTGRPPPRFAPERFILPLSPHPCDAPASP
jgi:hypothetical protein